MKQLNRLYCTLKKLSRAFWLKGAVGALLLPLAIWLSWQPLQNLLAFLGDRAALTSYLQGFGWWGPALLFMILSLQVIVAVIPGHVLMITGGYLYGFTDGLLLNLAGSVLASQAAFVLARWAGLAAVERFVPAGVLARWKKTTPRQGFFFFLIFFWLPMLPSNVMNFVAGLGRISFWRFFAANFIGRLPGVILVTLIGSHGFELSTEQWLVAGGLGLILFIAARLAANKVQQLYL